MLEKLWTLTGLAFPSPEQNELLKTIVIKPLNYNKMKSAVLKEDRTAENISNGNTEKISVQLVEEDNNQGSLFFDVEKEFSQIQIGQEALPPLPLSPTEEEECSVTSGSPTEAEHPMDSIIIDSETHMEEVDTQDRKEPANTSEGVITQWDSVIEPCPPAALACCSQGAVHPIGSDQIRTATLPHVNTSRPSLIRNSEMVPRTKDIDRYRVLYKIKYDSRKSRDSWLTLDGRLSIRNSKSGMPRVKQFFWRGLKDSKSTSQLPLAYVRQRRSQAKGQYFFWGGFACPIIWVIGAWYLEKTASSADDMWRRRCSRAAMLATVMTVCCLIVFFIVHPSIFVPRMSFKPPTGTTVFGLD